MGIRLSNSMKNVVKISSGQVVSILTLPFITRIYGAEIMGIWTVIVSISGLMNTVTDLGLSQAIMIEEEDQEKRTFAVVMSIAVAISVALSGIVWLYCRYVLGYAYQLAAVVVVFSFVYALTLQTNQISYTWLNKRKNYSALMKNPLINHCSMAVFAIGLGLAGFKKFGYFIGVTIGQIVTMIHMWQYIPKGMPRITFEDVKAVINRHMVFVKYQMPTNVTLQAREQVPNLLIGALFGNTMLGYFSISQKLLNIPVTFIGQSLGKVFYQRMAEFRKQQVDPAQFISRNIMRAMKIALIPMILLAAFGDAAIVMFFGQEYAIGGVVVRIVVFRTLFAFISTCTQGMDIVLEKQKYSMITCVVQTILLSAAIVLSFGLTESIYACAVAMTVCFIVVQVIYFCAIYRTVGLNWWKYVRSVAVLLASVLAASVVLRWLFVLLVQHTDFGLLEYLAGFLVMN